MNDIELERRIAKLERSICNMYYNKRNIKNENVPLSVFDCERLSDMIESNLRSYNVEVDINEDNADNGFINIGISCDSGESDYDIIVNNYNVYELLNDDKRLGKFNSLSKVADAISDHFEANYID